MRAAPGRNALLVLALLSVIWSYNWVVMKQVLQWTGPFEFAANQQQNEQHHRPQRTPQHHSPR